MQPFTLIVESDPKPEDIDLLSDGLSHYNADRAGSDDYLSLIIFLRDTQGGIVGGIVASTYWKWLYIDVLFVKEELRGQGYGQLLLEAAEQEAKKRGCTRAYLDTFSFQAPTFYTHRGYTIFGELSDFPIGHTRYFLQKQL